MTENQLNGATLVTIAEGKAKKAHAGLKDKAKRDYYQWHLLPIATGITEINASPEAIAAAWLHDIIEDTKTTAEDLLAAGFPPRVVAAVVSVTRRKNEKGVKEDYFDMIDRAAGDDLGRFVKLADNAWNIVCNPGLKKTDPETAKTKLRRYEKARISLLTACGLTLDSPQYVAMQNKMENVLSHEQ